MGIARLLTDDVSPPIRILLSVDSKYQAEMTFPPSRIRFHRTYHLMKSATQMLFFEISRCSFPVKPAFRCRISSELGF